MGSRLMECGACASMCSSACAPSLCSSVYMVIESTGETTESALPWIRQVGAKDALQWVMGEPSSKSLAVNPSSITLVATSLWMVCYDPRLL